MLIAPGFSAFHRVKGSATMLAVSCYQVAASAGAKAKAKAKAKVPLSLPLPCC